MHPFNMTCFAPKCVAFDSKNSHFQLHPNMRLWIFPVAVFCTTAVHGYATGFDNADVSNQDEAINTNGCPDGSKNSMTSTDDSDELVSALPEVMSDLPYSGDPSQPDDVLDASNGLAQKRDSPTVAPGGPGQCLNRKKVPDPGKERFGPCSLSTLTMIHLPLSKYVLQKANSLLEWKQTQKGCLVFYFR